MYFIPLKTFSLACLYTAVGLYVGSLIFFLMNMKRFPEAFFVAGFILYTHSQLSRGWFIGTVKPNAIVEGVFFLPWCLACLLLSLKLFKKEGRFLDTPLVLLCFFAFIASHSTYAMVFPTITYMKSEEVI